MIKRTTKILVLVVGVLLVIFALGPKVETPTLDKPLPSVPQNLTELNNWIQFREEANQKIKPQNEARIEFYDSIPQKTKYSVLYLHGFSASSGEGTPFHQNIAKHFKANLYLPRLFGHGLEEDDPMIGFTGDLYLDSAREALAVAKALGEEVIILGTSNGGTLSLLLGDDPQVSIIGLFSPNIKIKHPLAGIATLPWGLEIATTAIGTDYHIMEGVVSPGEQFWTTRYHLQAPSHMQKILEEGMTSETFSKIKVPVFMGYYYKDEEHQDNVVSVEAMLKMFDQLGTPEHLKEKMAFPEAGAHVLTSYMTSKDLENVTNQTIRFFETHLNK